MFIIKYVIKKLNVNLNLLNLYIKINPKTIVAIKLLAPNQPSLVLKINILKKIENIAGLNK